MAKILVALAVVLAALGICAPSAQAQGFGDGWQDFGVGWYEDNFGVVQCATFYNHLRCDKLTPWGYRYYGVVDFWWPGFCIPIVINPGSNAVGRPFSFVLAAPEWYWGGCFEAPQSQYWGFHDGLGRYEGQNYRHDFFTAATTIPIWPRTPGALNSMGTLVSVGWNI